MKQAQLLFTSISDYDQGKIGNNLMCVVYKQNYTYCLVGVLANTPGGVKRSGLGAHAVGLLVVY